MTVEDSIYTALKSLVSNRVYRDIAPDTNTTKPYITFQQVGGEGVNFMEASAPSKKNGRFQVNVWGTDRDAVMTLARSVEDTLRAYTALQTTVLGAAVAIFDDETKLYGSMQDFSCWT